jgi:uncharacterized phage-associated protein
MASVHDLAAYILDRTGPVTTWKLQKLVYYTQAWALVWDEQPMFQARIEAWANGPVVPELYRVHRRLFKVDSWPLGNPGHLKDRERETVDAVLSFYGDKPSQWLSDLTHAEEPWKQARSGLSPGERGNAEITLESMAEYYGSL